MRNLVVLAFVIACGAPSWTPPKDADEAIHRYVDAVQRADVRAILRSLAEPDRLGAVIHCATDPSEIELLQSSRGELVRMLDTTQKPDAITLQQVEDGGVRQIAKNDMFRGCIASAPFAVHTYTLHASLESTGSQAVTPVMMRVEVAQLDNAWYVLRPER